MLDLQSTTNYSNAGRIAVFGDSSCLDSSYMTLPDCYWLLESLLTYVTYSDEFFSSTFLKGFDYLESTYILPSANVPSRRNDVDMHRYSKVLDDDASPQCGSNLKQEFHLSKSSAAPLYRHRKKSSSLSLSNSLPSFSTILLLILFSFSVLYSVWNWFHQSKAKLFSPRRSSLSDTKIV